MLGLVYKIAFINVNTGTGTDTVVIEGATGADSIQLDDNTILITPAGATAPITVNLVGGATEELTIDLATNDTGMDTVTTRST